jgi:hypothetical protein
VTLILASLFILEGAYQVIRTEPARYATQRLTGPDKGYRSPAHTGGEHNIPTEEMIPDDTERNPRVQRDPSKIYVRENSPHELTKRIQSLNPLEREPVLRETYIGRWVHWVGNIRYIFPSGDEFIVMVVTGTPSEYLYSSRLHFSSAQRFIVEPLRENDQIRYEGKITGVDMLDVDLSDVTIS